MTYLDTYLPSTAVISLSTNEANAWSIYEYKPTKSLIKSHHNEKTHLKVGCVKIACI